MATDSRSNASHSMFFYFSITNCSSAGSPLASCLHSWHILAGVIIAICCLCGIPANIAVIVNLSRKLRGSSMSQRLFFNLALSDLLSLLTLPIGGVIFFTGPRLTEGVCQLLFYFFSFGTILSLNILVLISIQRYYQILHYAKWSKVNRPYQRFLLSSVWILAALLAVPVVFSLRQMKKEDEQSDRLSCNNQSIAPALEVIYIMFVVFCHVVLLSYYRLLARGVKQIQMADKKKRKVIKLFIRIIAASLIVGFLPLIARAVYVIALFTASEKILYISQRLTFIECFYFFNHCLNPLLYFFASRHQATESTNKRFMALSTF